MAKKKIKKSKKIKWPSRSEIRNYVLNDMFTENKWVELLNCSNTNDSWNIGLKTIREFKKKFKITRKILSSDLENYIIERISNDTKEVETLDYLKTKINLNLCFMINALKTQSSVE